MALERSLQHYRRILAAITAACAACGTTQDPTTYDDTCVLTRVLEARTLPQLGAGLAVFFSVDDCRGRPVTDLPAARFLIQEDDHALSSEASATVLPLKGQEIFVDLVLDLSRSTDSVLPQLQGAVRAFVAAIRSQTGVRVQIGMRVFGGQAASDVLRTPTLDTDSLESSIETLGSHVPADVGSTNLYGAILDSLMDLETAERAFRARNRGGAFTAGYTVLFTDGKDTASRATIEQVIEYASRSTQQIVAVALQSPDYDDDARSALARLAPASVFTASSNQTLTTAFSDLAERMKGQFRRTYLLGYCSPQRAGDHRVTVQVSGAENRATAGAAFSAAGFQPGCSVGDFISNCDHRTCGGLGCGACDDRIEGCTSDDSCVDFCLEQQMCHGEVISNPIGYDQTCSAGDVRDCGNGCVDTRTELAHCGGCDSPCTTACTDGNCVAAPPVHAVSVVAGGEHTCIVTVDGSVRCWGRGGQGQLGGSSATMSIPALVGVSQLDASYLRTCARLIDGTARCWGDNASGALGGSSASTPIPGLAGVAQIVTGNAHTCVLANDGTVRCWGRNAEGQTAGSSVSTPIVGLSGALHIDAGNNHTCALLGDGTVRCWGDSSVLGGGRVDRAVPGVTGATAIAAGGNGSCALVAGGAVMCWGAPWGTNATQVQGLAGAVAISLGEGFGCALMSNGSIRCWGENAFGQLAGSSATVAIPGLANATMVSAGGAHTCAVMGDNTLRCWGANQSHQCGSRLVLSGGRGGSASMPVPEY